jgi:predicted nucleotide-binding protein (sugar kinase/HSP70/actin superfamily)
MFENLPFGSPSSRRWILRSSLSPESSRKLYSKGQRTIPSDTVCYPAKLMHGHEEALIDDGVAAIFYHLHAQ